MTDVLRRRFGGGRRDWRWGDDLLPLAIGVWLARVTGDWWSFGAIMLLCMTLNGLPYLLLWWRLRWERQRGPIDPHEPIHGPQR